MVSGLGFKGFGCGVQGFRAIGLPSSKSLGFEALGFRGRGFRGLGLRGFGGVGFGGLGV